MNLALAIVALGGCGADLPPIELDALEPPWAYNGEPSEITVTGRNFYPSVTASSFAEPEVESDFRAWVETDPPTEVDYVLPTGLTTLRVGIPPHIDPGTYDFTVESSDGNRDTLEGALEVTPSRAAYLEAVVLGNDAIVGEWVTVQLYVRNRDGNVEPEDLEVNVVADPTGVEFGDSFDDQERIAGGVQGTLLQGQGHVLVQSNEEGPVWLTVTPTISTSAVTQATAYLKFGAGPIASIEVLVDDSEPIVAGADTQVHVAFLDENDQVVDHVVEEITISESCDGSNFAEHEMSGRETFPFSLRRATGPDADCVPNYVRVRADGVEGVSQPLTVVPGPAAQLDVLTSTFMTAGERTGTVFVTMEDAYDNALTDYETLKPDLQLEDDVGGLQLTPTVKGWQDCGRFVSGRAECTVEVWTADPSVKITATDGHGFVGDSDPFVVVPGPAADIQVAPQLPLVQAGSVLEVRIYVTDWPGNMIHVEPYELHLTDEDDAALDCAYHGVDPDIDEVHVYACRFYEVGTKRVVVDMASEGLFDFESFDIAVQNGELGQVTIDLGSVTTVGAGVTFYADLVGTDAWGNPYVVQSDRYVDVRDGTGSLTPLAVELDATGRALDQPMNVKRATLSNRIVATQDGNWLGSSGVFAVTAGAFEELLVDVDGPVVSIDDPGIVLVSAVDAYGNAIESFDDPVDLSSTSGLGNAVRIESWVDGRAAVEFPFDTRGFQDTLVADDGVNTGESMPFDVADFDCSAGPEANLEVGSGLPLRLCLLPGMGATSFDLSSSVAGPEPIEVYYYLRGDGSAYRTSASGWSTTWSQPGGYPVAGIVVDRDLCASESSGWVYVGYDDGQPVGPVDVSASAPSVHALDGWVTVDVSARTCSGDSAIGGVLLASVDIGDLVPSASSQSSGSGIELGLGAFGATTIEWSMIGQPAGGLATLVTGVRSGAARGEVSIDIQGDSSHPTVLEVSPVGMHLGVFDTIAVLFSDPMQAASISSASVVLIDPVGAEIEPELLLVSSGPNAGRELLVSFDEQTGAAGEYTLRLTSDLRKAPGPYDNANPLDGDFGGGSDDFVVSFGAVSDLAPDVLTCDPSTTLFRPDGDGTGTDPFEADVVELDLVANGPAEWWLLEVFDMGGGLVYTTHVDASGLDGGTIEWEGRSNDGTVLDNGTYVAAVTAKDASWNEGAPCFASLTIDSVLARVSE
jgi:hypothetical protein